MFSLLLKKQCTPSLMVLIILASVGCSHTTAFIHEPGGRSIPGPAHDDQVKQRILLIGDAGEPKRGEQCKNSQASCEPVLALMERWATKPVGGNKPFSLFLGDNIYPDGLLPESHADREEATAKWEAQYQVLRGSKSRGAFIPGNHDWGGAFGSYHEFWVRQQEFLKKEQQKSGSGLVVPELESGCPTPVSIDELTGVKIIVFNTQWWLTKDEMEGVHSCERTSDTSIAEAERQAITKLAGMLRQAAADNDEVIVATHHPLATHGVHGASYRFFSQDIRGGKNRRMVDAIQRAYHDSGVRPLIHAAGHDHSLQVLRGNGKVAADQSSPQYTLVSGAGSQRKLQSVGDGPDTLFAHEHTGIMVVDFMHDGSVYLQVIEPDTGAADGRQAYFTQLK